MSSQDSVSLSDRPSMEPSMKARGPDIGERGTDIRESEIPRSLSGKTVEERASGDKTESDVVAAKAGSRKAFAVVDGAIPGELAEEGDGDEVPESEPMDYEEDATPETAFDDPREKDLSPTKEKSTPDVHGTAGETDLARCLENLRYFRKTPEGLNVSIYLGDLTDDDADVIVNAANESLHNVGGVAWAIVDSGGYVIQRDCDRIICEYGVLPVGAVCHTTAGKLKSKHVIHAVAPMWRVERENSKHLLLVLLLKLFTYASKFLKAKSLAVPAIGTGVYGMPVDICASIFHKAVLEFSSLRDKTTMLDEIRIVLFDVEATGEFLLEFCHAVPADQLTGAGLPEIDPDVITAPPLDDSAAYPARSHAAARAGVGREVRASAPASDAHDAYMYSDEVRREEWSSSSGVTRLSTHVKSTNVALDKDDVAASLAGEDRCSSCSKTGANFRSMNCCQDVICDGCFNKHFKRSAKCPFCTLVVLVAKGSQPDDGKMDFKHENKRHLPGHEGVGTIVIDYNFPNGVQQKRHPNPGKRYLGARITAYLPANGQGLRVLSLLKRTFEHRLLFKIGKSISIGNDDVVVLNDIHLKTSPTGGPANHGYPDPSYLDRVEAEMAAKGFE